MFRYNSTNENRYVSFKFCARNYLVYDGLVNGKNGLFKNIYVLMVKLIFGLYFLTQKLDH